MCGIWPESLLCDDDGDADGDALCDAFGDEVGDFDGDGDALCDVFGDADGDVTTAGDAVGVAMSFTCCSLAAILPAAANTSGVPGT